MECFVNKPDGTKCGSIYHLARDCPHRTGNGGASGGKGSTASTHLAIEDSWETEYVQTFEEMFYITIDEDPHPYVPFGSSSQVVRLHRPVRAPAPSSDIYLHTDVFMIDTQMEEITAEQTIDVIDLPEGGIEISAGRNVYGDEEEEEDTADYDDKRSQSRPPAAEPEKT